MLEKYDALLGEQEALLHGTQKQWICIERAVVQNPKKLLFDEYAAALDTQSKRGSQLA